MAPHIVFFAYFFVSSLLPSFSQEPSSLHTRNATDSIQTIHVAAVYYLASDSTPLPDWKERISYHMERCQKFHERELAGQSKLQVTILDEPFVTPDTLAQLPSDDVNHFFWKIVNEVEASGKITYAENCFPILLVFSDMNFSQSYDDWTRVCDRASCLFPDRHEQCDGHVTGEGEDRPGSRCGGSRSVFWPERHLGLSLVSADGWKVPILGTDCVAYHEGIGHAIGLPHPEPINNSVMGLAQYAGAIHQTWIDLDQKQSLGWKQTPIDATSLFSQFDARHYPAKPKPNEPVIVFAEFPSRFQADEIHCEFQDGLMNPFQHAPKSTLAQQGQTTVYTWSLPPRAEGESIAYRVRVKTSDGQAEEIWHYYKIRSND